MPANQAEARLTITAPAEAPVGILVPVVVGTGMLGTEKIVRKAGTAEAVQQAFAFTHNVPTSQLVVAVLKPAAYKLAANAPAKLVELRQDSEIPITVKILRMPGVKAGVVLSTPRVTNGVTLKSAYVPPDKDEATLTLAAAADATVGLEQNLIISGLMKTGKENIIRYVPAIPIKVVAKDTKINTDKE